MRLQLFTLAAVVALAGAASAAPKAPVKAAKPSGDMEFEPDNATATPPSKTLERAIKLYDKKDFF